MKIEHGLGGFSFTRIIGIVLWQRKAYRLATYLCAKAVKIQSDEIIVRQGRMCLTVKRQAHAGHPLQAPINGAMVRTIHEHPACPVYYHFQGSGATVLEWKAPNAAFEYEY